MAECDGGVCGPDVMAAVGEALFAHVSVGLCAFDTGLRVFRANAAFADVCGVPDTRLPGRRLSDVVRSAHIETLERILERVLESGRPTRSVIYPGSTQAIHRHQRTYSVSAYRLQDDAGAAQGVVATFVDITDRVRSEARMSLLERAETRIGTLLDADRTAQELAAHTVPALADRATVDVLETLIGDGPDPARSADATRLRRARAPEAAPRSEAVTYPFGSLHGRCLADLQPRLVLDPDEQLLRSGLIPGADEAPPRSLLLVPLVVHGRALGVATFARSGQRPAFDSDDRALAVALAGRTALHLDNTRRHAREHTTAAALQRSLLPPPAPRHPGAETAASFTPGTRYSAKGASGDWYDVIPLSGARIALVVGEVVGHGVQAAATMGKLRAAVRALSSLDLTPGELLTRLNELVVRLAEEPSFPFDPNPTVRQPLGATCLYAVHNPNTLQCTAAAAGHTAPLAVYPDGTSKALDVPANPGLGQEGLVFESVAVPMPENTVLACYTHGLAAAIPPGPDGVTGRLSRVIAPQHRGIQEICDAATRALFPQPPADDAVLLLARTRALRGDQTASWEVKPELRHVATVRAQALRQLAVWNLDELSFAAELVISELVTNAVRYGSDPGSDPVRLTLILDRALICEVHDGSNTSPHLRRARISDEGGRGLFLVAQLTQRWGVRRERRGKTVWAEIPLSAPPMEAL